MANKDLVVKLTINSNEFDNGLKNAKASMNKFNADAKGMGASFKNVIGGMTKAFSALGVAMAAKNIFKDVMNSTEEAKDNWNNTMGAMQDSWHAFLFQVNNGNFQGLKDIISYAKQARAALDGLGDATALFNLDLGENQAKMTELLSSIQKKKKSGQDYSADVEAYNQLLEGMRNDAAISNKISYDALTALFGKHGVILGDYGLTPQEAARQARLSASGQYADVEALKKAMNTKPDLDAVSDFDITPGENPVEKLRNEWGKERFNRAMLLRTLGNITTEEKEAIEKILTETSARDRTIAQMEKQLNRYLNAEDLTTTPTGGTPLTEAGAVMTPEQLSEFMRLSFQESLLQGDRERDSLPIDIEIPNEDIIEEDTDRIVQAVTEAQEKMKLFAGETAMAFEATRALAGAFDAFGDVTDSTIGKVAKGLGGIIGQIIATVQAMMTLAGAETVEGVVDVFANTNGDVWTKLAMAAVGLAGILSIVASAKSSFAGSYADGGIVGGSSYSGDRLWARVNSGEMILNQSQQAALFGGGGGRVQFVIEGSQLKGVLDNYNKIENL